MGGSIMLNQYSITRARCRMAKSTVEIGGTALLLLGSDSLHLVAGRNPNRLRQSLIKNRKVLMGEIGVKKITHYEGHPCTRSNKSAHHLITFITLIKLVNHIKQKRRKKVYRTNAFPKRRFKRTPGFSLARDQKNTSTKQAFDQISFGLGREKEGRERREQKNAEKKVLWMFRRSLCLSFAW